MVDPDTRAMSFGIKVYGIPVSDTGYVQTALKCKGDRIVVELRMMGERMKPNVVTSPELPSCQCLWQLVLCCAQFWGNYWCRHLSAHKMHDFCKRLDTEVG